MQSALRISGLDSARCIALNYADSYTLCCYAHMYLCYFIDVHIAFVLYVILVCITVYLR